MNVLLKNIETVLTEKKSKFICNMIPIKDEEEAVANLDLIKKKYYDARHNCYAYVVGKNSIISKSSDDGEPQGTAGKPILAIINGENLVNVIVIVTRYFGGILLGTGGLQKAYSGSTKLCIENAKDDKLIKEIFEAKKFNIKTSYDKLGKIENFFKNEDGLYLINKNFDENIDLKVIIKNDKIEKTKNFFRELFSGKEEYNGEVDTYYYLESHDRPCEI